MGTLSPNVWLHGTYCLLHASYTIFIARWYLPFQGYCLAGGRNSASYRCPLLSLGGGRGVTSLRGPGQVQDGCSSPGQRSQCGKSRETESTAWRRNQMETFSAILTLCAWNSPATGEFPSQRPVKRSFDVFFDLRPNKRLGKQSIRRWFETQSRSLWRHCNGIRHDTNWAVTDGTDGCHSQMQHPNYWIH